MKQPGARRGRALLLRVLAGALPLVLLLMGAALLAPAVRAQAGAPDARPGAVDQAAIVLNMSVSASNACAPTDARTVAIRSGSTAWVCYQIRNAGTVTLTNHIVADSSGVPILPPFQQELAPGGVFTRVVASTYTASVSRRDVWAASVGATQAQDDDTVRINVEDPQIEVTLTAGRDPDACATTDSLTVPTGTPVHLCITLRNTGNVELVSHDIRLPTLVVSSTVAYALAPGAVLRIT
ncbi:MAG: hypothetical protein ACRC1H_05325, partial [Caldilineaceae bacterium]